jgi:hypothetical protein
MMIFQAGGYSKKFYTVMKITGCIMFNTSDYSQDYSNFVIAAYNLSQTFLN